MVINELNAVPSVDLPISEFSDHLHLGTGFADDGSQNSVLENYLRAALATIEARTGKSIFERRFQWITYQWSDPGRQGLPLAPISQIEEVKTVTLAGVETIAPPVSYGLIKDSIRPCIVSLSGKLPAIPNEGHAEAILVAGYGPQWADVPADLRQAVLLMATYFFENRTGHGNGTDLPPAVVALIETYRPMRLSGRVA